jgi:hypothetical protein
MGTIVMSDEKQRIYRLALEVRHNRLTIVEFSQLIKKSYRQSQRIVRKVGDKDMLGVIHGNIGRVPINKIPDEIKKQILDLIKNKYFDFNMLHLNEKLSKEEGIVLNRETLRQLCHSIHMVKRPKRRARKAHKPRPRMPKTGTLIQFDGSTHQWFGDCGPTATLIGGIDDADGRIVGLEFFPAEDTLNCLKVMRDIALDHGIPESYYLDQAGCFGKVYRKQTCTQVGRALKEVGCNVILAGSPQAKGRIERLWNTLQDRLIAELRLHDIHRIPAANDFLKNIFVPDFNDKFTVPARIAQSAFKQAPENVQDVFCIKEKRKIGNGNVFSWNNNLYAVKNTNSFRFRSVTICRHYEGNITFEIAGRAIEVEKYQPPRLLREFKEAA